MKTNARYVEEIFKTLKDECLKPGYHGEAQVNIKIQDGVIQTAKVNKSVSIKLAKTGTQEAN